MKRNTVHVLYVCVCVCVWLYGMSVWKSKDTEDKLKYIA